MIKDNKYTKAYINLMIKRQNLKLSKDSIYCERHHIIPKSLGGSDYLCNIVNLTAKEHYIAHLLLTKMMQNKDHHIKMMWALHKFSFSKHNTQRKLSSNQYDYLKQKHSRFLKEYHPSKTSLTWAQKVSDGVKQSWINDDNRKSNFAVSMKNNISSWRQDNVESFKEMQSKAANASKIANCTKIEYNGSIYVGWAEFYRLTGLTKGNYQKYYKHGIDPIFRKNKDGPISKTDVQYIIDNLNIKTGIVSTDLNLALDLGLITEKQMFNFNKGGVRNG